MSEPNYKRIVRLLDEKIASGEYPPGHRLPAERELGAIFGVSRITTRQALSELQQRGRVVRHQGQGTFVAQRPVESSLLGFFSISESLKADGRLVATRMVSRERAAAGPDEAVLFNGEPGEVVRIRRLRIVDGDPYALESSAFAGARFPGLEAYDFGVRSLYDVVGKEYGTELVRARETLAPVLLTREEAKLLDVGVDQPALRIGRTTFDRENVATEVSSALIRGDRCQLLFELWADRRERGGR